ncbi:hypothetical protein FIV34_08190 [Luteibacter pinisoli]|uniref:Uncharacterized protein n=1 Tax=Luteibacter pinisoli TaxID=2589080 RepID=A0A4Y5Z1J3_9GAMM|nr:hypothetical protein [Luteibacter pinisoli]QDE39180.1 hypothetical protein FIV34_08190 [Luteibacter pinisoli]
MSELTREELNARVETFEARIAGAVEGMRLEFGTAKAEILLAVKEEVHRQRAWILTAALAALMSFFGLVVTNFSGTALGRSGPSVSAQPTPSPPASADNIRK